MAHIKAFDFLDEKIWNEKEFEAGVVTDLCVVEIENRYEIRWKSNGEEKVFYIFPRNPEKGVFNFVIQSLLYCSHAWSYKTIVG